MDTSILNQLNERYPGEDNYGRPKSAYFERILQMGKGELFKEAKDKIWLSAYANNNPRSDFHWQIDAIYDVYHARGDTDSYKQAYRQVYIEQFGRDPYPDMEDYTE